MMSAYFALRLGRLGHANPLMTLFQANSTSLHPADARLLRVLLTYVLPGLAVLYVVVCGLWFVPDRLAGMYGNVDGHWASWSARGVLEWSGFLDFSPFSPLVGTGSLFAPNLPSTRARSLWRSRRRCRCGTSLRCWFIWWSCRHRSICFTATSNFRTYSRFSRRCYTSASSSFPSTD